MKNIDELKLNSQQISIIQSLSIQTIIPKNLESMYYGALKVLNDSSNPERLYLAAHCLRELTYYLTDHIKITDDELKERKEKLRLIYNKFKELPEADKYDLTLFDEVIKNLESQKPTHREQMKILIQSIDELGGIDHESIFNQWHDLHLYFVNVCHHRIEPVDIDDFKGKLHNLEMILFGLFGPFYESIDEIDKLIARETPDKGDIEEITSLIKYRSQFNYFFLHLDKPGWLIPLKTAKLLDKVPRQGDYSVIPIYLGKIVDKMPEEVAEMIAKLSKTNHLGAQVELVKAIQKIPFEISRRLIIYIKRWVSARKSYTLSLEMEIIRYIKQLFSEGYVDEAFELSISILFIKIEDDESDSVINWNGREGYYYEMKVKELQQSLCQYKPIDSIILFCKHLNWYLENNQEFRSDRKEEDLSLYWRTSIKQNDRREDINNVLVNTIRDCLESILANDEKQIFQLLSVIKKYNKTIFRRLELYLLLEYPDLTHSPLLEYSITKYEFNTLHQNFELKQLLSKNFRSLSEEEQIKYLRWVKEGPSKALELSEVFIKKWKLEKLKLIESHLKESDIRSINIKPIELKKHKLFMNNSFESQPQFFPQSPLDESTISNASLDDIINFINQLSKEDKLNPFSQEGFGRSFRNNIIKDPENYIPLVDIIRNKENLHWITPYLLDGFRGALGNNKAFEVDSIITLCTEFLVKSCPYHVPSSWTTPHPFRNLKVSLGWFVEEVLRGKVCEFDKSWTILNLITTLLNEDDEALSSTVVPPRDSLELRSQMSNTFPGIAISCLFEYIRWHYHKFLKNIEVKHYDKNLVKGNSKIKELLKSMLDIKRKQSYTIYYTFGVNLHVLILFDKKWVEENLSNLFPRDTKHQLHWAAILSGFLDFNYVYLVSYSILRPEFLRTLNLLEEGTGLPLYLVNSIYKFVEIVMHLYIEGVEELKNENSLVRKFFEIGSDNLRMVAIRHVGSILQKLRQRPDLKNIIHRLEELFITRIQFIKSKRVENVKEELSGFLFWIVNSIFEKDFTMNLIKEYISLSQGNIGGFYDVLEILNNLMNGYPEDVISCLSEIIKYELSSGMLLFMEKYRPILEKGIYHENQIIQTKTKEIINYIGKMGQHEFRDLLN